MKFGLLGTGHWARTVHAAALAAHPGVEFVGVWGRDPGKAAGVAAEYGVHACPSLDELLSEVDAVAVALPPEVQAELAVKAARQGCHLLLDKPLALDVRAAQAVVDEVDERGLGSVIFFTNRFLPRIEEALAQAAETGGWVGGSSVYLGSIYTPGSPYAESVWRQRHGGLWDLGPHSLSLLTVPLGRVAQVQAMAGPRQTAQVTLRHVSGAVSTMTLSLDCPREASRVATVLFGESGWLALPEYDGDPVEQLGTAITELLAQARGGAEGHRVGVHFGRDVVAVLAAAQESLRGGQSVSLL